VTKSVRTNERTNAARKHNKTWCTAFVNTWRWQRQRIVKSITTTKIRHRPLTTEKKCLASDSMADGSLHWVAKWRTASVATACTDSSLLRHCAVITHSTVSLFKVTQCHHSTGLHYAYLLTQSFPLTRQQYHIQRQTVWGHVPPSTDHLYITV